MGTGLFSSRKAASDQETHGPWWWALLRGSASGLWEKPRSVATGGNPAGAGTRAVIGLLSGSTLHVQLSSDAFPTSYSCLWVSHKGTAWGRREARGGGLASCLPLPQSLVLSFPIVKWPSQAAQDP